MQEFMIKVHDSINPNADVDSTLNKEGSIIHAPHPTENKFIWDTMLAANKVSQADYDAAEVLPGYWRWPWGRDEYKVYLILCVDKDYTVAECLNFCNPEYEDTGDIDDTGDKIFKLKRKRKYTIGNINAIQYTSIARGLVNFSAGTLGDISDKAFSFQPRYDKPISSNFVKLKT